ncbi:RidA family protein [Mesorhizobium sp. PL10]
MQKSSGSKISRVPGVAPGRSSGTSFGQFVWSVATAGNYLVGIEEQTRLTLAELDRLLAASGTSRGNVLSATIYLSNIQEKPIFDKIWTEWIGPNPAHWPQRACVEVKLEEDIRVEVAAVAARY